MAHSLWFGVGLGLATMGLHAAMRVLTHYLSLRIADRATFLVVELGGLGGRMALVFGVVALVLLFVPVPVKVYVGTVLAGLLVSMVIETRLIFRRMDRGTLASP